MNWDYIAAEVKSLPVCPELPTKGLTSRSAAWLGFDDLPDCLVTKCLMQGTVYPKPYKPRVLDLGLRLFFVVAHAEGCDGFPQ